MGGQLGREGLSSRALHLGPPPFHSAAPLPTSPTPAPIGAAEQLHLHSEESCMPCNAVSLADPLRPGKADRCRHSMWRTCAMGTAAQSSALMGMPSSTFFVPNPGRPGSAQHPLRAFLLSRSCCTWWLEGHEQAFTYLTLTLHWQKRVPCFWRGRGKERAWIKFSDEHFFT